MPDDDKQRISRLEAGLEQLKDSDREQWERLESLSELKGDIKRILYQLEHPITPPCSLHAARMDRIELRLSTIETKAARLGGGWDVLKIGLGALAASIGILIDKFL